MCGGFLLISPWTKDTGSVINHQPACFFFVVVVVFFYIHKNSLVKSGGERWFLTIEPFTNLYLLSKIHTYSLGNAYYSVISYCTEERGWGFARLVPLEGHAATQLAVRNQ